MNTVYKIQINRRSAYYHSDFQPNSCSVQVSVGSPTYEGDKLYSLLSWCSRRYDHVNICVNDLIQRHNCGFQKWGDAAEKMTRHMGIKWVERNFNIIAECCGKNKSYSIIHFDRWLVDVNFVEIFTELLIYIENNNWIKRAIEKDAHAYIKRNKNALLSNLHLTENVKNSIMYIIEEMAVFELQEKISTCVNIHAGGQLNCLKALEERTDVPFRICYRKSLYVTHRIRNKRNLF